MAGDRVTMILRSKTNLSDDQIARLSDAEGWGLIYTLRPPKSRRRKRTNQICFTGFSPSDKDRLGQLATADALDVVKSVTQSLAYLVTGPNAGPAKLKKAREQNVVVMNEGQFAKFLLNGEIRTQGTLSRGVVPKSRGLQRWVRESSTYPLWTHLPPSLILRQLA